MLGECSAQPDSAAATASGAIRQATRFRMSNPPETKKPRGTGLTCDGMRRCQRLPELRTPLIPRDAEGYIKGRAVRGHGSSSKNVHSVGNDRPRTWTA